MDSYNKLKNDYVTMQRIIVTLYNSSRKMNKRIDQIIPDLSMDELVMIITIVYSSDDELDEESLSQKMGLTVRESRNVLNRLKKNNYIQSVKYGPDKRKRRIEITEDGYEAMISSGKRMNQIIAPLNQNFTSEELERFLDFLQRVFLFEEERTWDYESKYSDRVDHLREVELHDELLKQFIERRKADN